MLLPKQTQVVVFDDKYFPLFKACILISTILGLSRPSVSDQEETSCCQENGAYHYVEPLSPGAEQCVLYHKHTNAASLCSWRLRKVVWALRRLADRISLSWRRRLKLLTSSASRKNLQPPTKRMLNRRNPCECLHFFDALLLPWVEHFFPPAHWLSPSSSAPSLRLAYKDLEQQRRIEEKKLQGLDGKKKEQAERLGMGLGARRYDEEEEDTAR